MKILPITALAATLCLGFAACDSKEEKARKAALEGRSDSLENRADDVRKETKADAKNMENAGNLQSEAEAKNLKKAGEATADALEDKAKQTREAK